MSGAAFQTFSATSGFYVSCTDTNLLQGNTAHIVQAIGGWANWYQAASPRVLADGSSPFGGSSLAWDSSAADDRSDVQAGSTPATVSASTVYTASVWVKTPVTTDFRLDVYSDGDNQFGTDTEIVADVWTQLTTEITTSAGASTIYPIVRANSLSRVIPAGTTYQLAAVQVAAGTETTFHPSLRLNGAVDIRQLIAADDYTPSSQTDLVSLWGGTSNLFWNTITTAGTFGFSYVFDDLGNARAWLSASPALVNGQAYEIRQTYEPDGADAVLMSLYVDNVLNASSNQTGYSGVARTPTSPLSFGSRDGTFDPFDGACYWAELRDGLDGPVVARWDASQALAEAS